MSAVTIEQIYEAAASGRGTDVDALIRCFPATARLREPGALALRGTKQAIDGDVPGGIALLKRATDHAPAEMRPYLVDLLVPLLVSAGDFVGAQSVLDSVLDVPEQLVPALLSARAVLSAHCGEDDESRSYGAEALELGRRLDNPLVRARVLQRVALTAFFREDFFEAQDRAMEAARAFEGVGAHRHAANAYTILYVIAHGWLGDPDLALLYAQKVSTSGKLAGDVAMQNLGLVAQLGIAAEAGDTKRLGSVRARLLSNRLNEQYRERFPFVLAEILVHGWQAHFAIVRTMCEDVLRDRTRSRGERAMCEAMLGLAAAAIWDLEGVRKYTRLAIGHSADGAGPEAVHEQRLRRIARILAAATCFISGEPSRGARALSRPFDPDQMMARLVTEAGMDEAEAPALLRGYARVINAARASSQRARPQHGLTIAEMRVLRALPAGSTVASLASRFGRSQKTVERQLTSIYGKLEVKNRAQAVQRARDLGIYA